MRVSRAYRLPVETDAEIKRLAKAGNISEAEVVVRSIAEYGSRTSPQDIKLTLQTKGSKSEATGKIFTREGRMPIPKPSQKDIL